METPVLRVLISLMGEVFILIMVVPVCRDAHVHHQSLFLSPDHSAPGHASRFPNSLDTQVLTNCVGQLMTATLKGLVFLEVVDGTQGRSSHPLVAQRPARKLGVCQ